MTRGRSRALPLKTAQWKRGPKATSMDVYARSRYKSDTSSHDRQAQMLSGGVAKSMQSPEPRLSHSDQIDKWRGEYARSQSSRECGGRQTLFVLKLFGIVSFFIAGSYELSARIHRSGRHREPPPHSVDYVRRELQQRYLSFCVHIVSQYTQ